MEVNSPHSDEARSVVQQSTSNCNKVDKYSELRAAPMHIFEVVATLIIAGIVFPRERGSFYLFGLLSIIWAAMAKKKGQKRERGEESIISVKKKAEQGQKEAQKREVESLNRKHLEGLRVIQKNLVYVAGLSSVSREDELLQTLRGDNYFGQYGRIIKIVVSKAKTGEAQNNQSMGVYVVFARKEDAARCIAAVDGSMNGERQLRAQLGVTKYCSAYLRGETCTNKPCMFLHEPGDNEDNYSLVKSESNDLKRQPVESDLTATKSEDNNIPNEDVPSTSLEKTQSLRSILIRNVASLQQILDNTKSELEDWDTKNKHLIPDLEQNAQEYAVAAEDPRMETFKPMMESIAIDKLPEFASKLRQQLEIDAAFVEQKENGNHDIKLIDCDDIKLIHCVASVPFFGGYNMLWRLDFDDGVAWAIKVSCVATVDKFDEPAAKALENEVLTMRFLKKQTTIPVPKIYSYDVTFDNAINCPFIMMEFVQATKFHTNWFDEKTTESEREERHERSLRDIANAMVQLSQFQCNLGGSLQFDDSGMPTAAGPLRTLDEAEYLLFEEDSKSRFGKAYELGPYTDPIAMITRYIDLHPKPQEEYSIAYYNLTRLFLSWLPQSPDPKFVLHHPDFNIQNMLVAEDGSLVSIVDWEGVCFQPKIIGNESYPLFLCDDWDIEFFECDEEGHAFQTLKNTIEELTRYRAMYARFIEEAKARIKGHPCPTMTRLSLLAGTLKLAVSTPYSRGAAKLLAKIMQEITAAMPDDPRQFCSEFKQLGKDLEEEEDVEENWHSLVTQIGTDLENDSLSEEKMGWLKDGFEALVASLTK